MIEVGRRGNVRKVKFFNDLDLRKVKTPSIIEIIKLAKENILTPCFGEISWYSRAIMLASNSTINRKDALNILANAFGYKTHYALTKAHKRDLVTQNNDYDPNDNYITIYENEDGVLKYVDITYR